MLRKIEKNYKNWSFFPNRWVDFLDFLPVLANFDWAFHYFWPVFYHFWLVFSHFGRFAFVCATNFIFLFFQEISTTVTPIPHATFRIQLLLANTIPNPRKHNHRSLASQVYNHIRYTKSNLLSSLRDPVYSLVYFILTWLLAPSPWYVVWILWVKWQTGEQALFSTGKCSK